MIASFPMNGGGTGGGGRPGSRVGRGLQTLHRSNSSLELPHSPDPASKFMDVPLRREYGSHGNIDIVAQSVSAVGENLFAVLQDFRPSVEQPATRHALSDVVHLRRVQNGQAPDVDEICVGISSTTGSSPKLRLKLNRLWGGKPPPLPSPPPPPPPQSPSPSPPPPLPSSSLSSSRSAEESCPRPVVMSADVEERHRRRAFAHYDCQSLTANLGYAAKLRGMLLARRRNTATGASAASSLRASTPDEVPEEDAGDGKGNDLLESCPFFRNEIGGEGEREVGLTRCPDVNGVHRPPLAYGVSVLEPPPGETLWKQICPAQKHSLPIENVDEGAYYYRRYFLGRDHQNWFGMDEQLGPVAISIRKEGNQFRVIVRTSELLTLRGTVPEEALGTKPQGRPPTKELLELVAPEVQLNCLRLGTPAAEEAVARLDEQGLTNRYKVGVLYSRTGQRTEEEMYNNQHSGPALLEFLDAIGQRIRLRGFDGYKAGLDTRTDSTGTHAVAASHRGSEVTFHVSTMLPFTPNNKQQLLRKRHIGNDIVTIVFQEPGAMPFSPRRIRSQFQHVFIIVRAIEPCSENTRYSVAVSRSREVPIFGPPVPSGATFVKGRAFADFILAKVINAENAAHRSEKFVTMATRTRQEYLKDLAANYSSATVVDTGQKFSMLSFGSKKKAPVRPRLSCDASQRGAICWQVVLEDGNQNTDCYLGISVDTIVLIEEHSRQIVFVTPCVNVLGWHAQANSLRLYHHQGECVTLHVRGDYGERDELMEIVARLRAVTQGSPASELSLRRNGLGQLGFHVQPDGVVTQVESMGLSSQAGLRQGSRLVEICKVAVSTLSHDQMVDLLKTSAQVTITVIPPTNDGNPRRGCTVQNCQYLSNNYEGDYENVTNPDSAPTRQTAMSHQRRYDRSFSPPRSSNSSGYGTGSSSRSFNDPRFPLEGTMTSSSSSGHSSADDRWYELLEPQEQDNSHRRVEEATSPLLPVRQNYQAVTPCSDTKGERELRCFGERRFAEGAKLRDHDACPNESSNHVSTGVTAEGARQEDYHRIEYVHQGQDHVTMSNYVKLQKERYEMRQENDTCNSRKDLHVKSENHPHSYPHYLHRQHHHCPSNDNGNVNNNNHRHRHRQRLAVSNSLPLAQNSCYGLPKSGSNNNLMVRFNDNKCIMYERPCSTYEYDGKGTNDKASKCEIYEDRVCCYEMTADRYEEVEEENDVRRPKNKCTTNYYDYMEEYHDRGSRYEADVKCDSDLRRQDYDEKLDRQNDALSRYGVPQEFKVGEKVTCLRTTMTEQPVPRKVNVEYRTKDPRPSLPSEVRLIENNNLTADIAALPSEDELSNGSGNVSPRLRRANNRHRGGNLTPSNGNSRNQSPRPKPGVRSVHRNSANLTSSTLQEDLMRLINPDYIIDDGQTSNNNGAIDDAVGNNPNSNVANNNGIEFQNRCRSRENLCGNGTSTLSVLPANGLENENDGSEVILTMARPATVISNASTASFSPASSKNKLSKEERLSPRVTKSLPCTVARTQLSIGDPTTGIADAKHWSDVELLEWPSLVVMDGTDDRTTKPLPRQDRSDERPNDETNAITSTVSDLQSHLSTLELRVAKETRRRLSLEDEVRRLRDENRRLQDESHAAAQQLRRFTEWFFQTIDRP